MTRVIAAVVLLVAGGLSSACSAEMPSEPMASAPTSTLQPEPLIDPTDLLSAGIPSVCLHAEGALVDGELPGIEPELGFAGLDGRVVEAIASGTESSALAWGANPEAAVAAPIVCSAGGVAWSQSVVLWDQQLRIVAQIDLGEISHGGRESVNSLTMVDGAVEATWLAQGPEDPACCGTVSASARLIPGAGGTFEVADLELDRGEQTVVSLVRGLTEDADIPDSLAADQPIMAIGRLLELGRSFRFETVACLGGELGGGEFAGLERKSLGAPTCWAELDGGEIVGFGLIFLEWGEYRVEVAYVAS